RIRKILDHIELVFLLPGIEQGIDRLFDLLLHAPDPLRSKLMHDQAAQLSMLGRIGKNEWRRGWPFPGSQDSSRVRTLALVGTDPWVVEQQVDLPVRADDIGPILLQ